MNALIEALAVLYCRQFHRIGVPVGSTYTCMDCWREYPVPWARAAELPSGCYEQKRSDAA